VQVLIDLTPKHAPEPQAIDKPSPSTRRKA
jgi:hypothetical protein